MYYVDVDGDFYGDLVVSVMDCIVLVGYVLDNIDCNDNNVVEYLGVVWFVDVDNDLFGNVVVFVIFCI